MFIKIFIIIILSTVFANEEKSSVDVGGDLPEWVYIENRLSTLESQIKSKQTTIENLIEEKNRLEPTNHKVKEIISQIVSIHKELQKDVEEYEKQKTVLRYRFPERGAEAKRKYKQIDIKSIDDIEKNQGVDSRLDKAVNKMRSQYESEIIKPKSRKTIKDNQDEKPKPIIIHK